jgi:hypothetical protein
MKKYINFLVLGVVFSILNGCTDVSVPPFKEDTYEVNIAGSNLIGKIKDGDSQANYFDLEYKGKTYQRIEGSIVDGDFQLIFNFLLDGSKVIVIDDLDGDSFSSIMINLTDKFSTSNLTTQSMFDYIGVGLDFEVSNFKTTPSPLSSAVTGRNGGFFTGDITFSGLVIDNNNMVLNDDDNPIPNVLVSGKVSINP